MRIYFLLASLGSGGAEMLVRNLSSEFARQGHECHVAYISDTQSLSGSRDFEQRFQEDLDAAGVTWEELGHRSRRNLVLGALRLRRSIARFKPDVVHHHLAFGMIFQAIGGVSIPTVYTHHNIRLTFPSWMFRIFDRFVDRYVAICRPCGDLLSAHVRRPIAYVSNGVPADFGRSRERRQVQRHPTVLSVGNLSPQKDYGTLIAAAARLVPQFAANGRRISFGIAGNGPDQDALAREIARRGLGEDFKLLGTRTDVADMMGSADLLALSSRWEGLPITLIEAAMSGLPVVATDVGGCSDIVIDGETGYLVAPGDPDALADAIAKALADDDRYAAMAAAARRHSRRFELGECARAHLDLYETVVSERGGRRASGPLRRAGAAPAAAGAARAGE